MYFCITGKNPEDAISRLMIDDLKKPSELGADILPAAEKTLMRGMALDSKERIHDIALLRKELEKVYPILSEEEKLEIKKKKQRRRTAVLSAAAALIVLVLAVIYVNRHSIPLYGTQKEAFFMEFYSRMSEQDRSDAMDAAEAAIGAFSEDNYYLKEDGDRVRFEIPEKAFEENDPLEEIRKFFAETVGANVSVYPAEPEDRVEWEAGDSEGAGAFQKDPGDIKSDSFWLVSYDISKPYDRDGGDGWRKAMAKRLDALQIPYAAGVDRYDFRKMWYCIPRSEDAVMNIGPEVLTLLGENTVSSIGGLSESEIIDDTGDLITGEKLGSGDTELAYRIKERRIEEAKLLLERLKAEGEEYIYLYINGTIVAKTDVSRAFITDNTISFDSWYSDRDMTIDESTLNLANCLAALTTTDANPGAPLTDCYILGYRDGYNKPEGKDYKPTFGPATDLFNADGGLRGDRDKNDDLEVITDTANKTVDAVYWCDENTSDEEILKRFRNFMTVFDKLLVDGWIKQINFKVMRGGDNSTPDVAMTLDFNGTALRYTADYMDDDNSREFFEQDSYFAEFSEDSETLDEFRKDGWEDINVSEIPERDDLNTFLYWYVLFGGSMGRVYNCLDPVNSYWETEVINLMDRIPYRTNYARQYSPEEKSDPRGWSEKEHFGWISINKKDEDWVLKNIFNCTDDQITAMIVEGESKKRIYQDGDQYCLCSLRSGVGVSGEEITAAKSDGKYYLIKYAVGTPAGEPEEGKLKDGSSRGGTYYALLKLKEIEGEKYWSLFYDGQVLPADIDTLCQHDPS